MWRKQASFLALLLMQVVLLASTGATAVAQEAAAEDENDACNKKNHMVRYLSRNKVQIYQAPKNLHPFCKSEWSEFGTCCEPASLQTLLEKKVQQNEFALSTLVREWNALPSRLAEFASARLSTSTKSGHSDNWKIGNGIQFQTRSGRQADTLDKDTGKLGEVLESLRTKIQTSIPFSISNQEKCIQKINKVVGSSSCGICSGRSRQFFTENSKLKISESLCRSVLADCTDAWGDMLRISKDFDEYTYFVRTHSISQPKEEHFEELGFTMNLDGFMLNSQLTKVIEQCGSKNLPNCDLKHVSTLCEHFIQVRSPAYILDPVTRAQSLSSYMEKLEKDMAKSIDKLDSRKTNFIQLMQAQSSNEFGNDAIDEIKKLTSISKELEKTWTIIQEKIPVLRGLGLASNKSDFTTLINDAVHKGTMCGQQLENVAAQLAFMKHDLFESVFIHEKQHRGKSTLAIAKSLRKSWDVITSAVHTWKLRQNSKNPNIPDSREFYEELDKYVLERQATELADEPKLAKSFSDAFISKILHKLDSNTSIPHQSAQTLQNPSISAQNRQLWAVSQAKDSLTSEQSGFSTDFSVVADRQCKPCVQTNAYADV